MPLPEPAERDLLHLRDISLRGYQRADGLFDIEAHLLDTKAHAFENENRGLMPAGAPLHGLWIRLTIREDMEIVACEASSDHTPYALCPGAAPNFARLAGLRIGPGFNRAVNERVGGVLGCTHLREVLGQMATVAYQTLYPLRARREAAERARILAEGGTPPRRKPDLVGSCIAYAPDSPITLKRWPWLQEEG